MTLSNLIDEIILRESSSCGEMTDLLRWVETNRGYVKRREYFRDNYQKNKEKRARRHQEKKVAEYNKEKSG